MTLPQSDIGEATGILDPKPAQPATAAAKAGQDDAKTFTQDELDKLMAERAKRASKTAVKEFLEELGFEKPDDLKALVTAAKTKADSEKTEIEKLSATLADTQNKLAEKERKRIEALISNEVVYHASQLGFINPKEALRLVDLSKISVEDDDSVNGAEEAVKTLAEQSKHLVKSGEAKKPAIGATNPAGASGVKSGIQHAIDVKLGRAIDTSIFAAGDGGVVMPMTGE
jgi:hypothetical protein